MKGGQWRDVAIEITHLQVLSLSRIGVLEMRAPCQEIRKMLVKHKQDEISYSKLLGIAFIASKKVSHQKFNELHFYQYLFILFTSHNN